MKFVLEEQVIIKHNGAVGLVIDREIENDEFLYVVSYFLNEESLCEQFNENELEKTTMSEKLQGEIK